MEVTKSVPGGAALQIKVSGDRGTVVVDTENKIRRALGGSGYEIKKQDGTAVKGSRLLPSAFFKVEKDGNIFKIKGGGYGHGIGMSQNGANEMAKKERIISKYYKCSIPERQLNDKYNQWKNI